MRRRRGRALRRRYGHASFGMKSHDLGNNESYGTGISYHAGQDSPWLALTGTQSRWFKTQAGAARWLAKRGYDAHGNKVRS